MAGKTKQAKVAHRRGPVKAVPTAKAPTILSGQHRVARSQDLLTVCGARREGWRYGEDEDVTCGDCQEVE